MYQVRTDSERDRSFSQLHLAIKCARRLIFKGAKRADVTVVRVSNDGQLPVLVWPPNHPKHGHTVQH